MTFYELADKVKRYYAFGPDEIKALLLTALAASFAFSFRDWGAQTFNVSTGFMNWFLAFIIVLISILVHVSAQKIAGVNIGFKVEYVMSVVGIAIGLILCFITGGYLWMFVIPGGIFLHHMVQHRLGFFRYGINLWSQSMICIWGLAATAFILLLIKIMIVLAPTNVILQKAFLFNTWYLIVCALPIPPLDGSRILFGTRGIYFFILGAVIGWALLLYYATIWLAIFGAIVIGMIFAFLFYLLAESGYIGK